MSKFIDLRDHFKFVQLVRSRSHIESCRKLDATSVLPARIDETHSPATRKALLRLLNEIDDTTAKTGSD